MTDTTTIEITKAQKDELESLKENGNYSSHKAVLSDLLDNAELTVAGVDETEAREIAREVVNELVAYNALQ